MSITVTTDSSAKGAMCTAHVAYNGITPPVPNDVHIDAKHEDGTWHAVTGYETIPGGLNPVAGFDIRFSGGNPNVGGSGPRKFRVRWTLDDSELGTPQETTTVLGLPPPVPPPVDEPGFLDYLIEGLKWLIFPITGIICLLCLLVGDNDGSCAWACGALPRPFRKNR
ncbi:MAG: hypothetical protein GY820_15090 [Gammaproteobacteria bacterium]|nr:hypothetical protein [Gammaproteobacteria bacterium]